MEILRWTWARTALGPLLLAASDRGLVFLHLGSSGAEERLARWSERHAGGARRVADGPGLAPAAEQLEAYGRGERRCFDLELDLRGTRFQRDCWEVLTAIPYGRTITYGDLARRLGRPPGTARAVGQANGANSLPIVVPCHRVVASGGLGGFSGGAGWKRRLLEHEGALLPFE